MLCATRSAACRSTGRRRRTWPSTRASSSISARPVAPSGSRPLRPTISATARRPRRCPKGTHLHLPDASRDRRSDPATVRNAAWRWSRGMPAADAGPNPGSSTSPAASGSASPGRSAPYPRDGADARATPRGGPARPRRWLEFAAGDPRGPLVPAPLPRSAAGNPLGPAAQHVDPDRPRRRGRLCSSPSWRGPRPASSRSGFRDDGGRGGRSISNRRRSSSSSCFSARSSSSARASEPARRSARS